MIQYNRFGEAMKLSNIMHKKIRYSFGINFFINSNVQTFFGKAIYNIANSICTINCRYTNDKIYANVLSLLIKDR